MTYDQYPKAYLYKRIVQAKLFIDKFFASQIDLDDMTSEAFFSKYHFIRMFKAITGYTPHQYLRKVRIEQAKLLLKEGESINEACYLVGFESPSSFAGLFKKMSGQTPAVYRRECLKRKLDLESRPMKFVPGCFAGTLKNSNFEE